MASKNATSLDSLYGGDFQGEGDNFEQDYRPFNEDNFGIYIRNSDSDLEFINEEVLKGKDWYESDTPITDEKLFEDYKKITQKQALQELIEKGGYTEEGAKAFLDELKKEGYQILNSDTLEGEHYFNVRLGNQLVSISYEGMQNIFNEDAPFSVPPHQYLQYFSTECPDIYKFYPGRIILTDHSLDKYASSEGVLGGAYSETYNTITLNSTLLKTYDFKNTFEHELTHRLDNYGGMGASDREYAFAGRYISDHPMFKIASEIWTASDYSNSYYGVSPHPYFSDIYRVENFAESTAPLGNIYTGSKSYVDTPLSPKGRRTSYEDYQKYNSYGDYIGRHVREAKTPKEIINFLNEEYYSYRERNSEIFEKYKDYKRKEK